MATLDLYINLKPDSLTGAFVVSHKSGAAYKLPAFKRQEKVPIRLFFVSPNATGGYSNPFTIQDVSSFTPRVAIGTSHTPLAGPGSWTWDSGNLCYSGVLNLHTTEMENALNSAPSSGLTDQIFEVELSKSGHLFRAQQNVAVKKCVLDDMAGTPEDVSPSIFASMMLAQLKDSNSVEWRNTGSDIYADVRRKTNGGIYEDADGIYVAKPLFSAQNLFSSLSVEITGAGSPTYTATPSEATDSVAVGGVTGERYACRIQVEFSAEVKGYADAIRRPADSTYFCQGGTPGGDDYNILSLTDGTTVWHLNRADAAGGITTATYEADIELVAGSALTLSLDSKDGKMIGSSQSATVTFVSAVKLDTTSTQQTTLARLASLTVYHFSGTTVDATPTELLIGGAGGTRLALADNTGYAFKAVIKGRSSGAVGNLWTERESTRQWQDIASSSDGTKLVAVASSGYIYTSTDSGVTWTARDSVRGWTSVASSADGTKLVAVVYAGQIYTSTDSGVTWTARDSYRIWKSVCSSADGTKLFACAEGPDYLYTSNDSGVTWTQRTSAGQRNWNSVACSSDGTKLAAGNATGGPSYIYTSIDSGATWTEQTGAGSRQWTGLASSSDGTKLFAVAYTGQIYTSTDSGVAWTARDSARGWYRVSCSSDGTMALASVYGGKVYLSIDSGVTWAAAPLASANYLGVSVSGDGGKMFTCVNNGKIYASVASSGTLQSCHLTGHINRDIGAASTALPDPVQSYPIGTPTWGFDLQADTTNGSLKPVVTGAAAMSISWSCRLEII